MGSSFRDQLLVGVRNILRITAQRRHCQKQGDDDSETRECHVAVCSEDGDDLRADQQAGLAGHEAGAVLAGG